MFPNRVLQQFFVLCAFAEMTVGKDKDVTVKSKGAGGQGKVAAKVTGPLGKPVASKVQFISFRRSLFDLCLIWKSILWSFHPIFDLLFKFRISQNVVQTILIAKVKVHD